MTTAPARESSQPLPRPPEYRKPSVNPWFIRVPILVFCGYLVLMLVLLVFVGAFELRYADKIVPGVSAYGVSLGGLTPNEAVAALEGRFTYDDEAVFTLRDGERFWQKTAGELGVTFDVEATAAEAFAAGHSGNLIRDLIDQASIWLSGHAVAPIVRYDQNIASNLLLSIAQEINRTPVDATLSISGTTVTATPSSSGRTLDVTATLTRLDTAILSMDTGAEIPMVINESPPSVWDAETAARKARLALSGPVTLVADTPEGGTLGPWTASVEQIQSLLEVRLVDNGDGTQSYDIGINVTAFEGNLEQLAPGLITPPQDARFNFDEETNRLEIIHPAVNGRTLNIEHTLERLEEAIFSSENRVVPMAFDYKLPRYHDTITAAELGITELISQATTYYTGSTQARRENIARAASRFNGIIIGPGEEFSYNAWLGDVSPEEGFVEGFVIVGGRTVRGVGGGVCQVSTTAFQAAFYAGFPIVERWAHGYRVGYYERGEGVGMDAAIYQGDPALEEHSLDLRFLNDTDFHLLIETSVYPGQDAVQFRFYSTNPGRQVVKEGPVISGVVPHGPPIYEENPNLVLGQTLQVDWAVDGADVVVTRRVLDMNGEEIGRQDFFSHYRPWQAIIQVAPGQIPAEANQGGT